MAIMKEGESQSFNSSQSYTVPIGGIYKLEVYGAQGGSAYADGGGTYVAGGGLGGYVSGTVELSKNETLQISIGFQGSNGYTDGDQFHSGATASGGGSTSIVSVSASVTATGGGGGSFTGWACGGCDEFDHDGWTVHQRVYQGSAGSGTYSNMSDPVVNSGVKSGNGSATITLIKKAMPATLYLGGLELTGIFVGNNEIKSAFLGDKDLG